MADLSPELAARVQSLEASYADNPGRYFVALAGAWRESGDVARAEEILRKNVGRFPGLSAHVLLGRCLADRGAFQEAANEFHYVLSIDSQNLIALRTLAEMAAGGGRRGEAERWYNELLAVDPMNVEARAALAQLARTAPEAPSQSPPASPAETGGDGFGMIDLSAPDASPADASGAAVEEDADAGEWGDLTLDAPAEKEGVEPEASAESAEFDAFGFGSVDLDAQPSGEAVPAAAGSSEWVDVDARQDVGESAAAGDGFPRLEDALFEAPLAGADLPLLDADAAPDGEAGDAGAGYGFDELPADAFADGQAAGEPDDHDVDAEVVTETMAELYASQGLLAQAADVYRELIGQRGEEPGLVRRLTEIEARMHPASSAGLPSSSDAAPDSSEAAGAAPDWLESVDAFARGGAAEPLPDVGLHDGLPELDLSRDLAEEPAAESASTAPHAGGETAEAASIEDFVTVEPAPVEGVAAIEPVPDSAGGESAPVPELVSTAVSADPFADSFAGGFDGTAGGEDERQAWEAPSVSETAPVGFDILVVEDEDGAEHPAPPEVVAEVSADWAIAAAPLEDEEEAAPAPSPAYAPVGTTMAAYFSSLLSWHPGASSPRPETYGASADEGDAVPGAVEPSPSASPVTAAQPVIAPAAPEIPTFEAPSFQPPAPAFGGVEPEGPTPTEDRTGSAPPEDEPWAAAPPAPADASAEAPDALPLLELEEPWADTGAPAEPVDIGDFELAEDTPAAVEAEEQLPWEVPAEPSPPAAAAPADTGGFSFEDFFAGAPAAPAEAEAEAEPELPAPPAEPAPAFIPSFAEPTPPPVFQAPAAPAPPPAAPAAGGAQDEDDEDLESFQAWLQSLKR